MNEPAAGRKREFYWIAEVADMYPAECWTFSVDAGQTPEEIERERNASPPGCQWLSLPYIEAQPEYVH